MSTRRDEGTGSETCVGGRVRHQGRLGGRHALLAPWCSSHGTHGCCRRMGLVPVTPCHFLPPSPACCGQSKRPAGRHGSSSSSALLTRPLPPAGCRGRSSAAAPERQTLNTPVWLLHAAGCRGRSSSAAPAADDGGGAGDGPLPAAAGGERAAGGRCAGCFRGRPEGGVGARGGVAVSPAPGCHMAHMIWAGSTRQGGSGTWQGGSACVAWLRAPCWGCVWARGRCNCWGGRSLIAHPCAVSQ